MNGLIAIIEVRLRICIFLGVVKITVSGVNRLMLFQEIASETTERTFVALESFERCRSLSIFEMDPPVFIKISRVGRLVVALVARITFTITVN